MKKRLDELKRRKYSINDSLYAIRRCIGALALLEDHCGVSTDRCRNCVEKHLLMAQAHADESLPPKRKKSKEREIEVELEVLKAEEYGREATTTHTGSKKIKRALERVPHRLRKLASAFYSEIGSKPESKRTPENWWKVGSDARCIRRWMQKTFNISKICRGMKS